MEHDAEIGPGRIERIRSEENPAANDEKKRPKAADGRKQETFAEDAGPKQFVDYDKHKKHEAPANKRPIGAMPQARQKPDDKQVGDKAHSCANPASPEWEIHVVAEPGPHGNVPAAPELRDGF